MRTLLLLLVLALAACQTTSPDFHSDSDVWQNCTTLAMEFRARVDSEAAANAGFPAWNSAPFLHSTRFYDFLANDVSNDFQAQELLSAMARLGDRIRRSENNTLSNPESGERLNAISQCSFMITNGIGHESLRQSLVNQLRATPSIQDHYLPAAQRIGLLPLLRPIFQWRIGLLHQDERTQFRAAEAFANPTSYQLDKLLLQEPIQQPVPQLDPTTFRSAYAASPLGFPTLSDDQLHTLFWRYAPTLTIETKGPQDLLGTPVIKDGYPAVDTQQAVAYYLPSYTRFNGENLLQLNYVFWFPSREPRSWIDIYSGDIDSLIWRVTLNHDGEVMLYDSIHSCGCYHKYFLASDRLVVRETPLSAEPANIFDLAELDHQSGLRLVISSNEHYIVGINNDPIDPIEDAIPYHFSPYSTLYNLESEAKTRSFFTGDGIIDGSERLERLTLWPTGINNVGAMRQWGTHATGFVANQHFDDATLFDKYLQYIEQ